MFGATLVTTIVPNVTTGHIADHLQLHDWFNGTGNIAVITDADYGAVSGGSAATNTAAINDAAADIIASGEPGMVIIPAGMDFPVTPDGVIAGSNVTFIGGGTLSTVHTTAGALITFPAGSTDCGVEGLIFEAPNDYIVAIAILSATSDMSDGITIKDNRTIQCRLVDTNLTSLAYASASTHATTGNVTRNVTIKGNRGVCSGAVSNFPWVFFIYTIGGEVAGNHSIGYGSHFQYWGGDASPATDGALANERKCGEITIKGERAYDAAIGGVWGSMGYDITVSACVVLRAGDVGIDFEGSTNCAAVGNIVRDCVNDQLATFSYSVDCLFEGNICSSSTNQGMARIQNDTGVASVYRVRFLNNQFRCASGIGAVVLETAQSATFSGNECENVNVYSAVNNNKNTYIEDNVLTFTVVAGAAFKAMELGANNVSGRLKVANNTIDNIAGTQPVGTVGIHVLQIDAGLPPVVVIAGNQVIGFALPIVNVWNGPGTGPGAQTWIRDNIIPVGTVITQTETGGSVSNVVKLNNVHADLTPA